MTYETPRALVESSPDTIRTIVISQKDICFDRRHLAKFGTASLDHETVY